MQGFCGHDEAREDKGIWIAPRRSPVRVRLAPSPKRPAKRDLFVCLRVRRHRERRGRGYQTGACGIWAAVHSAGWERLELETRCVAEDSVVRHEWDRKTDRSGGDPAVGGMSLLGERVAGRLAVGAELCVDDNELRAAVNNLNPLKLRFQPEHPSVAPASTDPAVPQLSSGLERDERGPARDERGIAFCKPRPGNEVRAEDVRVDDDWSARPDRAHDSTAARKAAPSSSLRSSITISSCGGSGRARRSSSSTGSSRCSSRLSGACVDTPQI